MSIRISEKSPPARQCECLPSVARRDHLQPGIVEQRHHHFAVVGEHCVHGFTNRDIRTTLARTPMLRECVTDPKKASAEVGRCFRRLRAHGLIAKIPRTRR